MFVLLLVYFSGTNDSSSPISQPDYTVLGQGTVQAVLRSKLAQYDCYVELDTKLVDLVQDDDTVTVTLASNGIKETEAERKETFD